TLGVHRYDELTLPGPTPSDTNTVQHVGMRQDHRVSPPACCNGSGGTVGQSDKGVVGGGFAVVRVAQVVHRVDERLVVLLEFLHHFPQIFRRDGVEPEMHMKY